ncbi:MAG: ribonuclease III [Flavobacteriaceae bacterium]|nr:MAG: ribonuclease III [Flavobacteriaceae bacterium]
MFGVFWNRKKNNFHSKLQSLLGFSPKNIELYRECFTHPSENKHDKDGNPLSFERLEFLGDALLDAMVSDYLFSRSKGKDEGYLSKMRAKIVSRDNLNLIGEELNLTEFLLEEVPKNKLSTKIYGDLLEGLLGAIYLDRGYKKALKFTQTNVLAKIKDLDHLENQIVSYKSFLLEWAQKNKHTVNLDTSEIEALENQKIFTTEIFLNGNPMSSATGISKKLSQEEACKRAYLILNQKI